MKGWIFDPEAKAFVFNIDGLTDYDIGVEEVPRMGIAGWVDHVRRKNWCGNDGAEELRELMLEHIG